MKIIKVRCKDYREGQLVKKINVTKNYFLEIYLTKKGYTYEVDIPSADMHYGGFDFFDSLKDVEKEGLKYAKEDMKNLGLLNPQQEKELEKFKKTLQDIKYNRREPSWILNVRHDNTYILRWSGSGVSAVLDFSKNPKGELRVSSYVDAYPPKKFSPGQYEQVKKYLLSFDTFQS